MINNVHYCVTILQAVMLLGIGSYVVLSPFFGFSAVRNSWVYQQATNRTAVLWFQRIMALLVAGIFLVAYFWIYFPALQDVPAYLAEDYAVAEGEVTKVIEGSSTFDIIEDGTGETIQFHRIRKASSADMGDHVKVAYLKNCKLGALVAVNSKEVSAYRPSQKNFFIVLMGILNVWAIGYILMLTGKIKFPKRKKYSAQIYQSICVKLLLIMEVFLFLGTLLIFMIAGGFYNNGTAMVWTGFVILYSILPWVLFTLTEQQIVVDGGKIFCNNFGKQYEGDIGDVTKLQFADKKQLIVALKDGQSFVVNDMEASRNQAFYEKLKEEVEAAQEENE